jgi:hypothetical protein
MGPFHFFGERIRNGCTCRNAAVAQLVEQALRKRQVVCSSQTSGTINFRVYAPKSVHSVAPERGSQVHACGQTFLSLISEAQKVLVSAT